MPTRSSDSKAIRKGIIVNTIFCGPFDEGVETFWKDGADRADGRYMSINQDEEVVAVTTPYDQDIVRLGDELNGTYVGYGKQGEELKERQAAQDSNAASMGAAAPVERSVAKAQAAYSNSGWDLVDALQNKAVTLGSLKDDELPAQMRRMSLPEKEKYVQGLNAQRAELQAEDQRGQRKAPRVRRPGDEEERAGQHAGPGHPHLREGRGHEKGIRDRVVGKPRARAHARRSLICAVQRDHREEDPHDSPDHRPVEADVLEVVPHRILHAPDELTLVGVLEQTGKVPGDALDETAPRDEAGHEPCNARG